MKHFRKNGLFVLAAAAVLLAAVGFRGAGLWHGLGQGIVYHPDEPKQVMRLESYLHGHYVHHAGNLFYDGYPYGLNRVDEAFLRIGSRAASALTGWVAGQPVPPAVPDRAALYRQSRALRLLYGVLAALLVYAAARRWGAGRWAALAGAALYAASPLAVTVVHSTTGDIGVDLFVALALWAASALAVGGRAVWWVVFGAACGAGWACKFQGALAAWMAIPPLLLGLRDGGRGWGRLAGAGLLAALGFAGAAVVLNPALALDTTRAWHDTVRNFGFIQNYGVPAERLAWPFGRKIAWGLAHNVPFVVRCLGWGLAALSLASALLLAGAAWKPASASLSRRKRRRAAPAAGDAPAPAPEAIDPEPTPEERAEADASVVGSRWLLGIATFPWVAFLLATALKLEIQPFHFSFLVPPMALCTALAVSWWTEPPDGAPRPLAAFLAVLLVAAALAEAAWGTSREMFFWRRPDIQDLARRRSEAVFGDGRWATGRRGASRWLHRFYAEPSVLPCFRNAESRLVCPPGAWLDGQLLLPVPSVPLPAGTDDAWIFPGGPGFPRNDRMFAVPATGSGHHPPAAAADGSPLFLDTFGARGAWTERILVYPAPPRKLVIGLRTGRLPARCEVATALVGRAPARLLAPGSQTVVELPCPDPVYAFPADDEAGKPAVWACRLRVRSQLGPVWVSILTTPEEEVLYRLHGPSAPPPVEEEEQNAEEAAGEPPAPPALHPLAADLPLYARELARLRYLDSDTPWPIPVAETADADPALAPSIPGAGPGLAAGAYRFRARVACDGPVTLRLALSDRIASDVPDGLPAAGFDLASGEHDLDWTFEKPFVPYDATLRASASAPGAVLLSWTLKPDPDPMAAPGWTPPPPAAPVLPGGADPDAIPVTPLAVAYDRVATLLDIRIPDAWHASDTIPYAVSARLHSGISHLLFADLAIFLHLENDRGELAGTLDFAFADASFPDAPLRWKLNRPSLPPGTYTLTTGLFNGRHGKKLPYAPHQRTIPVKTITVLPD